jgi:ketosteroid isomerase-like protein
MPPEKITTEFLDAFAEAFNRHDVEGILALMTEDCVFEASAGPDVCGRRYEGWREVGKAFTEVFETFPDAQWREARHFFIGDRGLSEWTFSGTKADGTRVEVTGCDVFTFRGDKIAVKNSYRKQRT